MPVQYKHCHRDVDVVGGFLRFLLVCLLIKSQIYEPFHKRRPPSSHRLSSSFNVKAVNAAQINANFAESI